MAALTPFLCLLLSGYASLNLDILSSSVTIAPLWVLPIIVSASQCPNTSRLLTASGRLYQHLKHQGRSYRKCYGYAHNHTGIPNRVDIDQRPEAVNNREVFGHWEADTIFKTSRLPLASKLHLAHRHPHPQRK
jgi:hypothetical protein